MQTSKLFPYYCCTIKCFEQNTLYITMILEISIKNYRSIKNETTFSLVAESSKSKYDNVFNQPLSKNDHVNLLKVAAIYGPNASGKTNIMRGLHSILNLIKNNSLSAGDEIPYYDPFKFDVLTKDQPSEFKLTFVGPSNIKHVYEIGFSAHQITKEKLCYYPKGQSAILFERFPNNSAEELDKIILGDSLNKKEYSVFSNKLGLETFGNQNPHEVLTPIFTRLKKINLLNFASSFISRDQNKTTKILNENPKIHEQLNELIRISDTKIEYISIQEKKREDFKELDEISKSFADRIYQENKYEILSWHNMYENGKIVGQEPIPLKEESEGTNSLYAIGGRIFETLQNSGVLFVDELDSSLHPFLSKILVQIFQSPVLNPHNAQLIFTSHDTHLLDRTLLRKDQIWFTEKNNMGITELYSLQDFDGVREDTPFDKWYLAGKFGAIPNIQSLEKLVQNG